MSRIHTLRDVTAYPLTWPQGRERTPIVDRKPKRWGYGLPTAMNKLELELDRWRIRDWLLSSDLRPHSRSWVRLEDPGAALWYMARARGSWRLCVLACDQFGVLPENIGAIALTLERLRLIEGYGAYSAEQVVQGAAYVALEDSSSWPTILGVPAAATLQEVEAAYRAKARKAHPDKGGADSDMARLNSAVAQARAEILARSS